MGRGKRREEEGNRRGRNVLLKFELTEEVLSERGKREEEEE